MTQPTIDVDAVVREVLRQLTESTRRATGDAKSVASVVATKDSKATDAAVATAVANEWRLDERLVTVATLARRPAGTRRVIVPRGAVVTPAALDELRSARIELTIGAIATSGPATAGTNEKLEKLYVHATHDGPSLAALVRLLSRVGRSIETLVPASLPEAVAELVAVAAQSRNVGVLVTRHVDAALCLANRHREVRAVAGRDKASVREAIRDLGANLLVLDPSRFSLFSLASLIETFAAPGSRTCARDWSRTT